MAETMYLLIGESGEYEQRYETILGLFLTQEQAASAVGEYVERSEREWAALQAFQSRVEALVVSRGFPAPDRFQWDHERYKEIERARADLGGEPDFLYFPERYEIVEVPIGKLLSIRPEYPEERPSPPKTGG